jgi:hypothetical protein
MSDLKILELFNTKAEKIHRSKFLEYLNREREVTCRITNDQVEVKKIGPDEDSISAAVLTLRMFIQKSDVISFKKMEDLYSRLNISKNLKDEFNSLISELNDYLDRYSPLTINSHEIRFEKLSTSEPNSEPNPDQLTNRQLMDIYLYGDYAHLDSSKRVLFERIDQNTLFAPMGNHVFVTIVNKLVEIIDRAVEMNKQAIEQLKDQI